MRNECKENRMSLVTETHLQSQMTILLSALIGRYDEFHVAMAIAVPQGPNAPTQRTRHHMQGRKELNATTVPMIVNTLIAAVRIHRNPQPAIITLSLFLFQGAGSYPGDPLTVIVSVDNAHILLLGIFEPPLPS